VENKLIEDFKEIINNVNIKDYLLDKEHDILKQVLIELEDINEKWNGIQKCLSRANFLTYPEMGGTGCTSKFDNLFKIEKDENLQHWEDSERPSSV
jgi:hypothetical protein